MTVFATMESRAPRAQLRAKGRGPLSGGGGRATDSMGDQRALVLWKGMRARLATTARAATASRTGQASLDMPGGGVWRPSLSERGRTLQRGTAFQVSCAAGARWEGEILYCTSKRVCIYSAGQSASTSTVREGSAAAAGGAADDDDDSGGRANGQHGTAAQQPPGITAWLATSLYELVVSRVRRACMQNFFSSSFTRVMHSILRFSPLPNRTLRERTYLVLV